MSTRKRAAALEEAHGEVDAIVEDLEAIERLKEELDARVASIQEKFHKVSVLLGDSRQV